MTPTSTPGQPAQHNHPARLLTVTALNAWYGDAHVLFDVAFHVAPGEVLALTGRNGAGKSTVLKSIMGLEARRGGELRWEGESLLALPTHEIARRGVGYVPEDRRIFTDLTVQENLETGRRPPRSGLPAWTPDQLFAMFPNLAAMPHRRAAHMSGGEQQMLTIARTLMGNPRLVLLDEPSEGVAPIIVTQMAEAIAGMKRQGLAVLLSEQNAHFVDRVADREIRLEQGRVVI